MVTRIKKTEAASTHRKLIYDGMTLVQMHDRVGRPIKNRWHVPGNQVKTTQELIDLANERGLSVVLVEISNRGSTTTRLN